MTNSASTKRENGSRWVNPAKPKSIWQYFEGTKNFKLLEEGRLAWIDEDDAEVAKFVPADPGDRIMHEAEKKREAERAERQPDLRDLQALVSRVTAEPDEMFPRPKHQWLMLTLIDNGANVEFKDKNSTTVTSFKAPWSAIDAALAALQQLSDAYAEKLAPAFREQLQQEMAKQEPEKAYSSKEYRERYEAITARATAAGIDKVRCLGIWGGTSTTPGTIDFSCERLDAYEAKLNQLINGETGDVQTSATNSTGIKPPADTVLPVESDESSVQVQPEPVAEDGPGAPDQENGEQQEAAGSDAGGGSEEDGRCPVPAELADWWSSQDSDYQDYFLNHMEPAERQAELDAARAMLTEQTPATNVIQMNATAVTEPDAGTVSASESATTGEYLEYRRNELVKTVEGYIVDADGVIINDETVFELLGLRSDFQITTREELEVAAGKINDLQARIGRRCGMFLRNTMPLFVAQQRAIQWYYGQFHRYGEAHLPRWDKDSREGVKNPHKAGDLKKKSLKLDEGVVYYRTKGGWKVESEAAIKAKILREMRVLDLNVLLPAEIREKYGAKLQLTFSKRKVYALAEQGEIFEGLKHEPVDEIGKIGIGDEKSTSMWTPDGLCKAVRSVMKQVLCQFKGIEFRPDDDEDEEDVA